jgi:hypothetical protein
LFRFLVARRGIDPRLPIPLFLMKRLFVGALALTLSTPAFSEDSAILLLARLPNPPADVCNLTSKSREEYFAQINAIARDIDAALAKRNKAQKDHIKQNEEAWREQMMKQTGLSDEQIARAKAASKKRGKAGAAARRALAEEMLQQHADLSIDEAKKLQQTEAGTKGTVKGYITQEMETGQALAQAQAQNPEEQAANQKKQERLAKLAALAKEQKELMEQTGAGRELLLNKMRDLEEDARNAYKENVAPIDALLEKLRKEIDVFYEEKRRVYEREGEEAKAHPGTAGDPQDIRFAEERRELGKREDELLEKRDRIALEFDDALRMHCTAFTPRYCDLLKQYLIWAREAQGGFTRYEEMENEKFKLQTDKPENVLSVEIGTLGMQEAKACVDLLRTAYKYALHNPNRPLDGSKPPDIGAAP